MLKSLHMKLVLILVCLVLSVMAIVGTFLINSVTEYNISGFKNEMADVFTPELILSLEQHAGNAPYIEMRDVLMAYKAPLGISNNRNFYILDAATGEYLTGSDDSFGTSITATPNIIKAMGGEVGEDIAATSGYFDVAIPVSSKDKQYVVGVIDNKSYLDDFTSNLISILVKAMFFGLAIVILLAAVLSKTITRPVERLIASATKISGGDFENKIEVESADEIGVLTKTFNDMAIKLKTTIDSATGERNKLNTMFLHMKDGVVAFNTKGNMIHINTAAESMLGVKIDAKKHYTNIFPNMHIEEEDLSESGKYIEIDYAAHGRILKIFIAPFGMSDEDGGLIAVLHDITEQKKLDDSRREFVANVSHELRTPLTNIKGYTETLIEAPDIDDSTKKEFLNVVHSEADRMTRIVKDLLTLSQLDYNKMELNTVELNIGEIAKNAVAAMMMEAKRQNVTLKCSIVNELIVSGDSERITQVIINIISNAIKYNKEKGTVDVRVKQTEGNALVIVSDTGVGIPKDDLPRIFERFYRVDKARSRERGGTGLGLAIAREIAVQHGGNISIESVYGEGSTVTMSLPAHKK